ncbi:MAG: TIGR00282 family metallophosphoesterase [Firmicutes bacterium]|nr:TIGR00282 family metallophosphoesterase [Bacillota bacterium]
MRLLFIGDVIGAAGRRMVLEHLPRLIEEKGVDFTVANGENAANGFGINRRVFDELHACGVDCLTMGNHTFDNKDIYNFIDREPALLRPANYPPGVPGMGCRVYPVLGRRLRVINLIGRVFMREADCPFRTLDALLKEEPADWTLVDMHAEATSEKVALGWYCDGRVSAVVGTHTHVPTADARLLRRGTGYVTDAGMTGPRDSVLGVDKDIILERFLTGFSPRFETASGDLQFNSVLFDLAEDGTCAGVERLDFWQPAL